MKDALIPAVAYARYSSSGQRDESIEGQCREIEIYAQHNGFKIIKTYTDKALTGRTDRRPGFQQMIADSEKQMFKAVICWKTDRFARNRYDAAVYKARLRKNGVSLLYAREAVPDGPEGIILESVMEGFAEYYSANLAENVKRGYYDSALKHKTLGRLVLGYRKSEDDTFEIDPDTAPIIRKIFTDYKNGKTMKEIYTDLNAAGYRTTSGGEFNKSSLHRILNNEKYIGVYSFQGVRDEDGIPALIDRQTWDICQRRLAGAKHKTRTRDLDRPDFLLTGKVFCGHCGSAMVGDSAKGKTGIKYWYYTCVGKKRRICSKRRESKQDLEDFVVSKLVSILHSDDGFLQDMSQRVADNLRAGSAAGSEKAELETRKAATQKKIQNLLVVLEDAPSKALAQRLADLEAQEASLTSQIEELAFNIPPELSADQILFMLQKLSDGMAADPEYRRRIVDIFLNAVYIYDDGRVVLHLNFTDGNDLASFEYTTDFVQSSAGPARCPSIRTGICSLLIYREPHTARF